MVTFRGSPVQPVLAPAPRTVVDERLPPARHPPYQDLLRAVGQLLDRDRWRDVVLAEDHAGLTVRGTRPAGQGRAAAERRLTLDDLGGLLAEAHHRRGWPTADGPVPAGDASYQTRLRAVGWLGEVAGLRGLRVVEAGDDLLLEGRLGGATEAGRRRFVQQRLTPADIAALLQHLGGIGRRDTGRPGSG
jgi:hypothetical protein